MTLAGRRFIKEHVGARSTPTTTAGRLLSQLASDDLVDHIRAIEVEAVSAYRARLVRLIEDRLAKSAKRKSTTFVDVVGDEELGWVLALLEPGDG